MEMLTSSWKTDATSFTPLDQLSDESQAVIEDVYLRVADDNKGPLNREEVGKLEYNRGIRVFEDEVREDFDPEALDRGMCESYREAVRY